MAYNPGGTDLPPGDLVRFDQIVLNSRSSVGAVSVSADRLTVIGSSKVKGSSKVTVYRNGIAEATQATADTAGNWSYTFSTALGSSNDDLITYDAIILSPTTTVSKVIVIAPPISIAGIAQVGRVLTASEPATFVVGGVAKNYLALSNTYTCVAADVGQTVAARNAANVTSDPTAKVINAALPAVSPTIPYGVKTCFMGDSIVAQNTQGFSISTDTPNGGIMTYSIGEITQLLMREARINFDNWYDSSKTTAGTNRYTNGGNNGIKGQSSTTIAARVNEVIALGPGLVIINMGTNNTTQRAIVLSDIQSTVSALRTAGIAVIVCTIRPNGLGNESTARSKADIVFINNSIKTYVAGLADPLVVLCDLYEQYQRGDGYIAPEDCYDLLLHPNARGAELGGWGNDPVNPAPNSLGFAIRKLVQPGDRRADIIAATTNFLANSNFATMTGGTPETGILSGTVPSSWRFGRKTSSHLSTAEITYEPNAATGGNSMVIKFTAQGSNAGELFQLYKFQVNQAGLANQWIRTWLEVETDGAGWVGPQSVSYLSYEAGVASNYTNCNQPDSVSPQLIRPVAARRLILSDALLLRAGATAYAPNIGFLLQPAQTTPGSQSIVKVHRAGIGIVPNPKTVWGL